MPLNMKRGEWYEVTIKGAMSNNARRVATMQFLCETDHSYLFSLRPLAGTQTIDKPDVIKAVVSDAKKPSLPKRAPKEVK